jgi:proton-translocating NADH-quinone oxidoreductase chain L
MQSPALLLLVATLLPLAGCITLLAVGKKFGNTLAGFVSTAFIALSFAASLGAMLSWYYPSQDRQGNWWGHNREAISIRLPWIAVGGDFREGQAAANLFSPGHSASLDLGLYVDSLTIAMFAMITLVATLVHAFSIAYMREEPNFCRYFIFLSLFVFAMLGLAIGGTLVHLFIFWELVGLCSYLLIGFWSDRPSAANAAFKAFLFNRIADIGFIIGMAVLFRRVGNLSLPALWVMLSNATIGSAAALPDGTVFSTAALTLVGICLFVAAMGKSAQFPLHGWLPDAMEAPTPVSALIPAARWGAAGVYFLARIYPILTPNARLFVAIIGLTTLTMAALIALVQTDIKLVLAWSTVSQLGYMMLALGIGSWVGGLFHLLTHAFFKALLFLGAGSVIAAAGHEREMERFGGLWRRMPITAVTFAIGGLALCALPGFSGFYSKETILTDAGAFGALGKMLGHSSFYWAFFILPTAVGYLTAFYMTRCWMLTFAGTPRDPELNSRARETQLLWAPLVFLAIPSIFGGNLFSIRELLQSSVQESQALCYTLAARRPFFAQTPIPAFTHIWADDAPADERTNTPTPPSIADSAQAIGQQLVDRWAYPAFAVGIMLGVGIYSRGFSISRRIATLPIVRWVHHWLYHGMYFDELYFWIFLRLTTACAALAGLIDRKILDPMISGIAMAARGLARSAWIVDRYGMDSGAHGVAVAVRQVGAVARRTQTGRIRVYVTILVVSLAMALLAAAIVILSRS